MLCRNQKRNKEMTEFYKVSSDLAKKLSNPFLTPKDEAISVKGGVKWEEEMTVENMTFLQDAEDPLHEQLRVSFRIPVDSDSPNAGRGCSEMFNFYWGAIQAGGPDNRVMQTQIAYREFTALMVALGEDGYKSPGEVDPKDYRGVRIKGDVSVVDDKTGTKRQRVGGFRA
jgi:hypothetical protein